MTARVYKFKGRWHVAATGPTGTNYHCDWSEWRLAMIYAVTLTGGTYLI